jgi:two-component system response regulator RstA
VPFAQSKNILAELARRYDGQDRSIDVRISRIRPKIGDDPDNPKRIKTVRSKGYLFVADLSNG